MHKYYSYSSPLGIFYTSGHALIIKITANRMHFSHHTPWPSPLCFHSDAVTILFHCKSSFLGQTLRQKSCHDSSHSQGEAKTNYGSFGVEELYSQGLYLSLPLMKAYLTNKVNHTHTVFSISLSTLLEPLSLALYAHCTHILILKTIMAHISTPF